jgi:hypothetical protein
MRNWVMEGEANRSWDLASLHQTSTKEVTAPAAGLKAARAPPVAVDDGVPLVRGSKEMAASVDTQKAVDASQQL